MPGCQGALRAFSRRGVHEGFPFELGGDAHTGQGQDRGRQIEHGRVARDLPVGEEDAGDEGGVQGAVVTAPGLVVGFDEAFGCPAERRLP